MEKFIIITRDFKEIILVIGRPKQTEKSLRLWNQKYINQIDLIGIYSTLYPTIAECTLFSIAYEILRDKSDVGL